MQCLKCQAESVGFCGRQWGAIEGCMEMGNNGLVITCYWRLWPESNTVVPKQGGFGPQGHLVKPGDSFDWQ